MNLKSRFHQCAALALSLILSVGCGGGGEGSTGTIGGGGVPPPKVTIQRLQPSKMMVGFPIGALTVNGTNFTTNSQVIIDGVASPDTSYESTSELEAQLPGSVNTLLPQAHTVQVTDPANGKSNIENFDVYVAQPGPNPLNAIPTQYLPDIYFNYPLVADLNGDGCADLVVLEKVSGSDSVQLMIRYGQTDGTFSAPQATGLAPMDSDMISFIAGDFTGDGFLDLVLITQQAEGKQYQVLLNDGTAHFRLGATGTITSGGSYNPAAVGDFNHDGKLDFIVGGSSTGQALTIYPGNGDGTFGTPVAVGGTSVSPYYLTAVDLNHDGYTDAVYSGGYPGTQTRLTLMGPKYAFTDVPLSGLPSSNGGFAVGDFNDDGIPDILAVDANGKGWIFLGNGNGTFKSSSKALQVSGDGVSFPALVVGDFDHDGEMDVAAQLWTPGTTNGANEIGFLWGNGKGNFTQQAVVDDAFYLQTGDVNGDGITDILAVPLVGDNQTYVSVVLGRNDRSFPSPQVLYPSNYGYLSVGPVFGGGVLDLLVSGYETSATDVLGSLYVAQPNATFQAKGEVSGYGVTLADLNGDGIADLVGFDGSGNLLIWKGDGSGTFGAPITEIAVTTLGPTGQMYFRDMDGDGNIDIVMPGTILYGKGNFQFDVVAINTGEYIAVGDFDGDGIPDIATPGGVMFGEGGRVFTAPTGTVPDFENAAGTSLLQVADINGDGKDDLIVGDSQDLLINLSLGREGFTADQVLEIYGYANTVSSMSIADFNGDGLLDIAVGISSPGDVVMFTQGTSGEFSASTVDIGINPVQAVTADFNHDGKPDLAFRLYTLDYEPPTVVVAFHK